MTTEQKIPLYDQLCAMEDPNIGKKDMMKIVDAVQFLGTKNETKDILTYIHVLILHHYKIKSQAKWGAKSTAIPYGAKPITKTAGLKYNLDALPEDLQMIIYKFLKVIIVNF